MNEYEFAYLRRAGRVDRFVQLMHDVIDRNEAISIVDDEGNPLAVVISKQAHDDLLAAYTEAVLGR